MDTEENALEFDDNLDMDIEDHDGIPPQNLQELLIEVQNNKDHPKVKGNLGNSLVYTLRKYKYWPALQVKKFFYNKNLVLLHNTYKRTDVDHFQKLYDECRSVVLNLNAPAGENVIVTFSTQIPERLSDIQYEAIAQPTDICEESYEGTVVNMYYYDEKWYICTSTCPTIDSSRYFHPKKTHGNMFDEAIAKIFQVPFPTDKSSSQELRKKFTDYLDTSKAYTFILVHYQNSHTMNYTPLVGEEYAKLIHIVTRSRGSLIDDDISNHPLGNMGITYSHKFNNCNEAIQYLRNAPNTYGIYVNAVSGKRYKVSVDSIIKYEEHNLKNPNIWHNMLAVYIQNKQEYKITDFLNEFCKDFQNPKNASGQELVPTYLIHTIICNMRDILYDAYIQTTTYNTKTKRYFMNKKKDKEFAPIIRFHLAQLRNFQITTHTQAIISQRAVYHYICHHQTLKNLRHLIKYFATQWFTDKKNTNYIHAPGRLAECFVILDNLLSA